MTKRQSNLKKSQTCEKYYKLVKKKSYKITN